MSIDSNFPKTRSYIGKAGYRNNYYGKAARDALFHDVLDDLEQMEPTQHELPLIHKIENALVNNETDSEVIKILRATISSVIQERVRWERSKTSSFGDEIETYPSNERPPHEDAVVREQEDLLWQRLQDSLSAEERYIIREHCLGDRSLAEIGREIDKGRQRMSEVFQHAKATLTRELQAFRNLYQER